MFTRRLYGRGMRRSSLAWERSELWTFARLHRRRLVAVLLLTVVPTQLAQICFHFERRQSRRNC